MEKFRKIDDEDVLPASLTAEQLGETIADLEASENSERNMLLKKVSELYDKLERQLEQCIQLKEQNYQLKKELETRSRERQDSVFQQNDRNLFNMFMEKIAELQQENTRLRMSGGDSHLSSLSNSSRFLTQSPRSEIPKSPLGKTPTYSLLRQPMASRQNIEPCVSPSGRIRSSIDQMWHSAQRQTVFSKLK